MDKETISRVVSLRKKLINNYESLRDYKTNKNALMKEVDHAAFLHETILEIDSILKGHVNFS